MIFLFPLVVHAAEVDLEKDLIMKLEKGRAILVAIQKKIETGSSVSVEIAELKNTAEDIRLADMLLEERFKLRGEG